MKMLMPNYEFPKKKMTAKSKQKMFQKIKLNRISKQIIKINRPNIKPEAISTKTY